MIAKTEEHLQVHTTFINMKKQRNRAPTETIKHEAQSMIYANVLEFYLQPSIKTEYKPSSL